MLGQEVLSNKEIAALLRALNGDAIAINAAEKEMVRVLTLKLEHAFKQATRQSERLWYE